MTVRATEKIVRKWGFFRIRKTELIRDPEWTVETDLHYVNWLIKKNGLEPSYIIRLCGACKTTAHTTWEKEILADK
jgi:hypothetical protein